MVGGGHQFLDYNLPNRFAAAGSGGFNYLSGRTLQFSISRTFVRRIDVNGPSHLSSGKTEIDVNDRLSSQDDRNGGYCAVIERN